MSEAPFRLALIGQGLIEQPVAIERPAARELARELRAADMVLCDFEACLGVADAWPVKLKTPHTAAPEALDSLRELGVNALALANNHAFDLGPPGLTATRSAALARGFAAAGSGETLEQAGAPAVFQAPARRVAMFSFDLGPQADLVYAGEHRAGINPLRIRKELVLPASEVARLRAIAQACGHEARMARRIEVGYSDEASAGALDFFGIEVREGETAEERRYPDPADLARALEALRSCEADFRIVSFHSHHWDPDWTAAPRWLQALAASFVEAGADAVHCHGAPVLQGMSLHRGKPIFYGMGNFIFHTARAPRYDRNQVDVWRSIVALCDFSQEKRLQSISLRPIRVGLPLDKTPGESTPRAPEWLPDLEAQEVIERFLRCSALRGASLGRNGPCWVLQPDAGSPL